MWKKLMSVSVMALLVTGVLNSPILAKQGTATVNVSYSTDREVSVEGNTSLVKGTNQHSYKAYFDRQETQNVVWEIKGNTSENTKIDVGGFLAVGVQETSNEIEVIAYSANQITNYSSNKVSLVDKTYEITKLESADLPTTVQTLPYGTTENDLHKMFSKWNSYELTFHTNDDKTYQIPISEASYSSTDIRSDANGIIQPGTFVVAFTPKLPYVLVDFDDEIQTDDSQETNITGNHVLTVTYTIEGNMELQLPVKIEPTLSSGNAIKGTAKAEESNAMFVILILLAGSLSTLCLLKNFYNHKHHNTMYK